MEVSASSPDKNEELTLALKTWSRLEEETTGRFKGREGTSGPGSGTGSGTGSGVGLGGGSSSREGGDWMGIAERKMDSGSGSGMRRTGGGVAVEVDNQDDEDDGTCSFSSARHYLFLSSTLFISFLHSSCLFFSPLLYSIPLHYSSSHLFILSYRAYHTLLCCIACNAHRSPHSIAYLTLLQSV